MERVVGCKLPSLLSETSLAAYGELAFCLTCEGAEFMGN